MYGTDPCKLEGYPTHVRVLSLMSTSVATCVFEWLAIFLCRGLLLDLDCFTGLLSSDVHVCVQAHSMIIDSIYVIINRYMITEEIYKQVATHVIFEPLTLITKTTT